MVLEVDSEALEQEAKEYVDNALSTWKGSLMPPMDDGEGGTMWNPMWDCELLSVKNFARMKGKRQKVLA